MSALIPIHFILIVMAIVVVGNTIALIMLVRSHLKLKYNYQILAEFMQNHNNDITELYSFAQSIDDYKNLTDQQMNHLYEKIIESKSTAQIYNQTHTELNESSNHPYNLVIQQVRSGASVTDLMQNSGLCQDEAALLIRLHGIKKQH